MKFRLVLCVSVLLIGVGLEPALHMMWRGAKAEPLVMPLPLKRGQYTSPLFTTWLAEDYQVSLYFLPVDRRAPDIDWKIVDRDGAVIQSGASRDQPAGGNAMTLGHYWPKPGSRQKIIVDVKQDVGGRDTLPNLYVGVPEVGLENGYGSLFVIIWAAIVGGSGLIMFLAALLWRVRTAHASRV